MLVHPVHNGLLPDQCLIIPSCSHPPPALPRCDVGAGKQEELAFVGLCDSGPELQVLICGKATYIWMGLALHAAPRPACPFGREGLQYGSGVGVGVRGVVGGGVGEGGLADEPQVASLDLCKAQSFVLGGSHEQDQLADLLLKLRHIATLVIEYAHQSACDHAFLESFHSVLEDGLAEGEVVEVVAIGAVFT